MDIQKPSPKALPGKKILSSKISSMKFMQRQEYPQSVPLLGHITQHSSNNQRRLVIKGNDIYSQSKSPKYVLF